MEQNLTDLEEANRRINEAIHHAVVIRDAAGYKQMAVARVANDMIDILTGSKGNSDEL